ncbi:sensor domain-containing diguanylate cyclase [Vibrio salinus]|uniref:sensor domain-containing diguanylate cyclase n=1 Tax=Vibrio salinus TaxID=2899784 RepID=UPI001E5290D0|nr:sensor domain-containing diguanylate cyclase [Vibrio salinus]MCE0494268.1 sensor domain-containing diguanylate cyclase [Vibrio salinus]
MSSILIFFGCILLLSQRYFNYYWITIILSNGFLLFGFYYQVSTALCFEIKKIPYENFVVLSILILYGVGFYYYTFIDFNTMFRVLIVSIISFMLYFFSIACIFQKKGLFLSLISKEIWMLFIFSCAFYLVRITITIAEYLSDYRLHSLFDKDVLTSLTFIFLIVYNTIFLNGMFNATLRDKNRLLKQDKNRFTHLFEFLNDTAKHLDLQGLYKSIESILRKSFGVPSGAIYLKDEGHGEYSHTMAYLFNELELPINQVKTFKMGEGLSGKAVEQEKVIIIDIDSYPNKELAEDYKSKGVSHMVSIPLIASNEIIGAITIVYSIDEIKKELFDKKFLLYLGEQISLVLHNAILYNKLSGLANTDFLTGLYNRRKIQELFHIEEKRFKRNNKALTIALIDLDHFKIVNDTYGHECGDEVLKCMANALKKSCRDTDYICRWGGEEFLIIFVETTLANAKIASERILTVFSTTTIECTQDTSVTASIGLAQKNCVDETLDELTIRADKALYEAKSNGRNQVRCSYPYE